MPISNVYNQDCMEFMSKVDDKFFELVIVDPPYNIVSRKKRGIGSRIDASGKMNDWNNKKPDEQFFNEIYRISNYQIVWGANNFEMPPSEYFIIWDKNQTVDNFASAEYAWTNLPYPAKVFRYHIHQHNIDKGEKIHPTMKPVRLYKWILANYAVDNWKIFDPMMGSQSSRIAAFDMGHDFWGCEIDEDYFRDGCKRFEQHKAQLTLFQP